MSYGANKTKKHTVSFSPPLTVRFVKPLLLGQTEMCCWENRLVGKTPRVSSCTIHPTVGSELSASLIPPAPHTHTHTHIRTGLCNCITRLCKSVTDVAQPSVLSHSHTHNHRPYLLADVHFTAKYDKTCVEKK